MTQTPSSQEAAAASSVAAGLPGAGPLVQPTQYTTPRNASVSAGAFSRAGVPPQEPGLTDRTSHNRSWRLFMFEEQSQLEIDALIKANPEFKQLYQRHRDLDKKVMDAELGVLPIDDNTLNQMKREKLAAKDRLVRLYDSQHH